MVNPFLDGFKGTPAGDHPVFQGSPVLRNAHIWVSSVPLYRGAFSSGKPGEAANFAVYCWRPSVRIAYLGC